MRLVTNHDSTTGAALRVAASKLGWELRTLGELGSVDELLFFGPDGALLFLYGDPPAAEAALDLLQRLCVPVAVWQVDDPSYLRSPRLRGPTTRLAQKADLYFTHTAQVVDAYARVGVRARYLPTCARVLSGMEALLAPPPPEEHLCYDYAFVGALFELRRRFLARLEEALPPGLRRHVASELPHRDALALYRATRVNLAFGCTADLEGDRCWAPTERAFEVPLVGGFLLQDERRHLAGLFQTGAGCEADAEPAGPDSPTPPTSLREAVTFTTFEECAHLVLRYCADRAARVAIASRAQARVLREHVLEHRLAEIGERLRHVGAARPREVFVHCPYPCLGDSLCFLGAARTYAREHRSETVLVSRLPEVVREYKDPLLRIGGPRVPVRRCEPGARHRVKERSRDRNYVGTFLSELGIGVDLPPRLEQPALDPPAGLLPRAYVALQPRAGSAANPDRLAEVHRVLVEACRAVCPEWPVVAVGRVDDTPQDIEGVDFRHLGGPTQFLRLVQHAALVLTPRSAAAHAAAAYGTPTFVWLPDDGENWHLDYPDWPHVRVGIGDARIGAILTAFLRDVRRGSLDRVEGVQLALLRSGLDVRGRLFCGLNAACPEGLIGVAPDVPSQQVRRILRDRCGSVDDYPPYLNQGNALEFVRPHAAAVCRGAGLDIGAGAWPLPGAVPIDQGEEENAHSITAFADEQLDFVFSSHCLEHLDRPADALALWTRKLRRGGALFLYLPHPAMEMWRVGSPWVPEHKWIPTPEALRGLLEGLGLHVAVLTEVPDAYWSFRCVARRPAEERGRAVGSAP